MCHPVLPHHSQNVNSYPCQVIQRRPYGKPVDVWSTGILLHILLSGTMPFLGTKDRLYEAVCAGKLYLGGARWQAVSEQVQ